MVDVCSTIKYQTGWGFRREPARPLDLRIDYCGGMRFDDNFDWDNAWYDAMQVNENTLLLIGPPLYDSKNWINGNVAFFDPNGQKLPVQFMELDRVCYTAMTVGGWVDSISMVSNGESVTIPINKNHGEFDGKKVMVTLQKNNPIAWIGQWMHYHIKVHGVDAFLIYDNGSTDYSAEDLDEALRGIPATIKIVEWPYPYGPQGSDHAPWDSDYGQYVMLEHAKYRYLSGAGLVLNNDIDEMIVTKGLTLNDIQQHLSSAQTGCLRYRGVWIEPYDLNNQRMAADVPFEQRYIRDFFCTDSDNKIGIGYKWMLVPQRHLNNQWLVHHINAPMIESDQLHYAHYLALNTNWSWKRDVYKGNISNLRPDPYLLSSLAKMDRP